MFLISFLLESNIYLKLLLSLLFLSSVFNLALFMKYFFYFYNQDFYRKELLSFLEKNKAKRLNSPKSIYFILYEDIFDFFIANLDKDLAVLNRDFTLKIKEELQKEIGEIYFFDFLVVFSFFTGVLSIIFCFFDFFNSCFLIYYLLMVSFYFIIIVFISFFFSRFFKFRLKKTNENLAEFQVIVISKLLKLIGK